MRQVVKDGKLISGAASQYFTSMSLVSSHKLRTSLKLPGCNVYTSIFNPSKRPFMGN